jgi:hypothetical protein
MYINIHKSYRDVVAIADENLIGKIFEEEKSRLEVKEAFYKGEKIDEEKLIKIIKDLKREDATFNIVGNNSISAAIKAGAITKENVLKIKNIPYSLILL